MKQHIKLDLLINLLLIVIILVSCKKEYIDKPFYDVNNETISQYLNSQKDSFDLFLRLIQAGDLESTLAAYNPFGNGYTLFLPTNEAVNQFVLDNENYNSFQDLLNNQVYVNTVVRFHVANIALNTNDFPFGALPDTTLSGDLLTIGFRGELDSLVQEVNSYASIINPNIYLTNGYIHIIDKVLKPVVFNSYEWLKNNTEYELFSQALELTELKDTFNLGNGKNKSAGSSNTLLVESNEVFRQKGIFSIDDLKDRYSPDNQEFSNSENGLYQFVAYHVLEGEVFLNDFEGINTNFNTLANFPVSINGTGIDIKINTGVQIFDSIITGIDTSYIDFISFKYDKSNVITKNGAIHFIDHVMELYKPKPRERTLQFYEEPLINDAEQGPNTYEFKDPDKFEVIKWEGIKKIQYTKSVNDLAGVMNNDYLELDGDFSITYNIPKILPGSYMFRIRANADYYNNAYIQLFIDGKRIGGNIDLTTHPGSGTFYTFNIGQISFIKYQKHQIGIQTLIPGRLQWDAVIFQPISNN